MQELQSSGGVLCSVQTTLPEAAGQVGVEPAAVSREWLPGAPCSLAARAEHENSCCDRLGATLLGVFLAPRVGGTTCLLGTKPISRLRVAHKALEPSNVPEILLTVSSFPSFERTCFSMLR